ncbi:uncharacterized protein LOC135216610 [Macrobrachium nipponense]|uniref:uncharacterized protein LOC135216610 n=1 Tax=Macrobrachium nipponense TaxID=159736 RepID=UPI0030C8A72B
MQRQDQKGEAKDSRGPEVSMSPFLFFLFLFLEVPVLGTTGLPDGLTASPKDSHHNTHNYLLGKQDEDILKNAARQFNARAEVADETANDQDNLTVEALALSVNGEGVQRGNITISFPGRFTVFNAIVDLRLWNHVCISVQGIDVQVFHDGQRAEPSYVQDYDEIPSKLLASRFVNFTSDYMDGASTFCGYLASLQILQGLLTVDQVNFVRLRNFAKVPFRHYPYVIDVIPYNKTKILTSCAIKELFKRKYNFSMLRFRVRVNYSQALLMCTGYGGTLPVLEDAEHREIIAEYLLDFRNIDDTWMQMSSNKISRHLELPWCPLLYKREGVSFVIQWDCMNFSVNLICLIPKGLFLKLKGHVVTNENEFAIQQGNAFERITLESRRNLQGLWKGSAFQVQTRTGEVQFQVTPEGEYPIGRRDWLTKDNKTIILSLSTCSPEEFSCNNGQCIPIEQRCDGNKGDCFDLSDDDSSCDIFLGPDRTYYELQAPMDRKVSVDLWMRYIRSIDVNENTIKLCLIPILLQGSDRPLIDEEALRVRSDNQSLPIYHVSAIRCRVVSSVLPYERDQVVVAVLIDRRSKAFFLTMLGPCIVLEMLGHLSFLAFPIDEFYQRASTSLSLLIVVASLFSQSVSNLPKSASPKAIDVWFFYFILRFFLFFVAHCLVEFQRFRVQSKKNGNSVQILQFPKEETKMSGSGLDADECQDGQGQRKAHRLLAWIIKETSKTTPFQPETINLVCLLLGVAIDATFIALFVHFLGKIRSNIYDEFLEYKDCS